MNTPIPDSRFPIPVSLEFFPPKTDEQRDVLEKSLPKLKALAPDYVSVTFGAGGSTLSYTPETVRHLRDEHGLDGAPHVSCMGGSRSEIRELLQRYRTMGCKRVVALRGDLPSGMATHGDFRYATDLVEFIRAETGDHFHIEVACYPEVHPVFLQRRCLFPLRRCGARSGRRCGHRAGHHADLQLQPTAALLGNVRRRNSALADQAPARAG
jgi:methylenetetrahydrofolate reductase (NADPH)